MAASACFGAPALNMLLGIGGSYLFVTAERGEAVIFEHEGGKLLLEMSAYFLLGVLGFIALYIPCFNFYASRPLAVILMLTYAGFMAAAVIVELSDSEN
jgi:sodium/potassium/calcium exchanger 6